MNRTGFIASTLARAWPVLAVLLLSGCLSLGGGTRDQAWPLDGRITPDADWPARPWQLAVARPVASGLLDSPRIAVRPAGGDLQVYAGARWADRAPVLVQDALLAAFEDAGRLDAVVRQSSGARSDRVLLLDLRAFEARYGTAAAPDAHIALQATLIDPRSRAVLAQRRFSVLHPAEDTGIEAVVRAFNAAMSHLGGELVGWVLAQDGDAAQDATGTP